MTAPDSHATEQKTDCSEDTTTQAPTLAELDRDLVRLLSQRVQYLRDRPPEQRNPAVPEAALAEAQLPEYLWHSLDTACRAATVARPAIRHHETARHITIVGGSGVMGRFFAQRFEYFGHRTAILGRRDWERAREIMACTDLVLFCVPIDRTIEIVRALAPQIPPTAAIADITSVKVPQLQAMLEAHPGPVVGLHPMFGPGVESFLSQKVVVCDGRDREAWQWLVDLMDSDGADLIYCTAEEHDRLTIAVQAIRHFATFSLGIFLAEAKIDIGRSLDLSSPIYRIGIDMVSRLFGQDAELYVDIMLATPERKQAIGQLAQTFVRLAERVASGDREGLIAEFASATATFGRETERAVDESDRLIEMLSVLLASQSASNP